MTSKVDVAYDNGTRWSRDKVKGSVIVTYNPQLTSFQLCDSIARSMFSPDAGVRLFSTMESKETSQHRVTRLYYTKEKFPVS